jgi:hypothetical protein
MRLIVLFSFYCGVICVGMSALAAPQNANRAQAKALYDTATSHYNPSPRTW